MAVDLTENDFSVDGKSTEHAASIDIAIRTSYTFDDNRRIWHRLDSKRAFNYSDGDEAEEYIATTIQSSFDRSSTSLELQHAIRDWPSNYHLNGLRANLLRPLRHLLKGTVLEIGAGTGALTRYLGEAGCRVFAIEGSERRAAIAAERTTDLSSVSVVADNIMDFPDSLQFDVVTLIGVLEYARIYIKTPGQDAVDVLLSRAKRHLRPGGVLIVAIENQLGLKYFAGNPEDHLGVAMAGIEDAYLPNGVVTFGRMELEQRLMSAGIEHQQWWFPQPSYKLPLSILSDRTSLFSVNLSRLASEAALHDPQNSILQSFSAELAWQTVGRNGLTCELANSFLVVSSDKPLPEHNTLAIHYGGMRRRTFQKETRFEWRDNEVKIQSRRLYPDEVNTDKAIMRLDLASGSFFSGDTWQSRLVRILSQPGWTLNEWTEWARVWFDGLLDAAQLSRSPVPDAHTIIPGDLIDAIPRNFVCHSNGTGSFFDKEWVFLQPLELGFVVYRGLSESLNGITACEPPLLGTSTSRMALFQHFIASVKWAINPDDLLRYSGLEKEMQYFVAGGVSRAPLQFYERIPIRLGWKSLVPEAVEHLRAELEKARDDLHSREETIAHQLRELSDRADESKRMKLRCASLDAQLDKALAKSQPASGELLTEVRQLNEQVRHLHESVASKDSQVRQLHAGVATKDFELDAFRNSTIWRMTSPLRRVIDAARKIRR